MKTININTWNRKEHFNFFSQYDEPFFGIVSEIDCTNAYKMAKSNNESFFAAYLHKSLVAINKIPEFRYRINEKEVVIYDEIHAASTIGRDDGTFGFGFIQYNNDFQIFSNSLAAEIAKVQNTNGLCLSEDSMRNDTIHYSSVPWIKFTGLTHARNFKSPDSVPKIVFGKTSTIGNKMTMPISINAHHGLLDGLHIAKYLEIFQELMNEK